MFLSETSWIRFGRYFGIFKVFMSDDSIWKFLWIGTRLKISKCQKSFFSHFFVTDAQKGPSFWMFYLLNLHFPIFYWDPRNWSSFWTLSWDVSTTENRQTCSVFRISNLGKQRVPPLRFAQNLTLWGLDDKNVIFLNLPLTYAFLFLMKSEPKSLSDATQEDSESLEYQYWDTISDRLCLDLCNSWYCPWILS